MATSNTTAVHFIVACEQAHKCGIGRQEKLESRASRARYGERNKREPMNAAVVLYQILVS